MKRLLDIFKPVVAFIPSADIAYGTPTSDWVNMSKYREANLHLSVKSSGGSMTAVVKCSAAADGSSATAIAGRYRKVNRAGSPVDTIGDYVEFTSSGFSVAANSDGIFIIEVRAEDLTEGKPFVGVTLTQGTAGAIVGAGSWLMGDGHYAGKGALSAVS